MEGISTQEQCGFLQMSLLVTLVFWPEEYVDWHWYVILLNVPFLLRFVSEALLIKHLRL